MFDSDISMPILDVIPYISTPSIDKNICRDNLVRTEDKHQRTEGVVQMVKIPATESAQTFREVAKMLREKASDLDLIAADFEVYNIEALGIPNKATAIKAIRTIGKWVRAADDCLDEAKISGGAYGENTEGMGPLKGTTLRPRDGAADREKGGKSKSSKRSGKTEG